MDKDEFALNSSLNSVKIMAEAMIVIAEKFLFQREKVKLNKNDTYTLKSAAQFIEFAEGGEQSFIAHSEKDSPEDDVLAYLLYRHTLFGLEMGEKITLTISELKSIIAGMKEEIFADNEIERVKLFFSYLAKGIP